MTPAPQAILNSNNPVACAQAALATAANADPAQYEVATYQHYGVMRSLVDVLRPHVGPGQMLLWRDAFRWRNDDGALPNHFECMSLHSLCEEFGYEVVHDFCHAAVVKMPR